MERAIDSDESAPKRQIENNDIFKVYIDTQCKANREMEWEKNETEKADGMEAFA